LHIDIATGQGFRTAHSGTQQVQGKETADLEMSALYHQKAIAAESPPNVCRLRRPVWHTLRHAAFTYEHQAMALAATSAGCDPKKAMIQSHSRHSRHSRHSSFSWSVKFAQHRRFRLRGATRVTRVTRVTSPSSAAKVHKPMHFNATPR